MLARHRRVSFMDASFPAQIQKDRIFAVRTAKDRPRNVFTWWLMLTLVIGLHILGIRWFIASAEPLPLAQPLPMEIALVKLRPTKPEATKAVSPPAQLKPRAKKPQLKPKLKKQPAKAEAADFSKSDQVLAEQSVVNNESRPILSAENDVAKIAQPAYTEAYINAAYEHNPKPDYPYSARSRGWQGTVILRVRVKEDGNPESVEIHQSSGHEPLDESALEAVKQWRFIPAKLGETAVDSSVLIPINFALEDREEW